VFLFQFFIFFSFFFMTPIVQSAGLMTAVGDFGNFIITSLTNHAGFFLTLGAIGLIFGLIKSRLR
jgi:hypothetical protein